MYIIGPSTIYKHIYKIKKICTLPPNESHYFMVSCATAVKSEVLHLAPIYLPAGIFKQLAMDTRPSPCPFSVFPSRIFDKKMSPKKSTWGKSTRIHMCKGATRYTSPMILLFHGLRSTHTHFWHVNQFEFSI